MDSLAADRHSLNDRLCSKVGCDVDAIATLTYVYDDATAVLGPLAFRPEPHSYDLCARHAARLSVPQGWTVVRYSRPSEALPGPVPA